MKVNWKNEKENLSQMLNDKISYEEIGRYYNISGNAVKKAAKKIGLKLEKRRNMNSTESFNKGKRKTHFCKNCGKEFTHRHSSFNKFCDNKCHQEYIYKIYIERWKNKEENGSKGGCQVSSHVRRYLFEKYNNRCQKCNWSERNIITNTIPLQIHHKDGDCTNNMEENLELLCPNCHSLTENYGILNGNSKRFHRPKITKMG